MIPVVTQFIIVLIVCGFLFWALQLLLPHVPLPSEFRAFIDVALKILIVGIIVFYFIVPLIRMLPGVLHL